MNNQRKGPAYGKYGAARTCKAALIFTTALAACPALALAQSYNVVDATGKLVGPLMSDAAISQGVEISITFNGAQCAPTGPCNDREYLLIPWSVGGMGQDYIAYFGTNNMPETNWFYSANDPQCQGQPYLKVMSAKTTAARPYDVVGGDSQAGSFYWPGLAGGGTQTAASLDIGYKMASPIQEFFAPNNNLGESSNPLDNPAYVATGACEPAWVKPADLFAPMYRDNFASLPVAGAQDGYVSPFDIVQVQASSRRGR